MLNASQFIVTVAATFGFEPNFQANFASAFRFEPKVSRHAHCPTSGQAHLPFHPTTDGNHYLCFDSHAVPWFCGTWCPIVNATPMKGPQTSEPYPMRCCENPYGHELMHSPSFVQDIVRAFWTPCLKPIHDLLDPSMGWNRKMWGHGHCSSGGLFMYRNTIYYNMTHLPSYTEAEWGTNSRYNRRWVPRAKKWCMWPWAEVPVLGFMQCGLPDKFLLSDRGFYFDTQPDNEWDQNVTLA